MQVSLFVLPRKIIVKISDLLYFMVQELKHEIPAQIATNQAHGPAESPTQ
jgi:hypothetical protein